MPDFEWDPEKARSNLLKHGVAFEDAELVWSDPLHLIRFDRSEGGEDRWHALGLVGGVVLIIAVHTYPGGNDEIIRLVSARRATKHERKVYEDGDL